MGGPLSSWPGLRVKTSGGKNAECDLQSRVTMPFFILPYSAPLLHSKNNWYTVDMNSL